MVPMKTIAGIELGGTKALAVLARGSEILASARFATTTPNETLGALVDTLEGWKRREGFAALGIASFGPLRLDYAIPVIKQRGDKVQNFNFGVSTQF